jgi:curved DNA-binding protein CbpA
MTSTDAEIKVAYKKQANYWHPDKNSSPDAVARMKLINEAYLILKDSQAKTRYNREYKIYRGDLGRGDKSWEDERSSENARYQQRDYSACEPVYEFYDQELEQLVKRARRYASDIVSHTLYETRGIVKSGCLQALKTIAVPLCLLILIVIHRVLF